MGPIIEATVDVVEIELLIFIVELDNVNIGNKQKDKSIKIFFIICLTSQVVLPLQTDF